MRYASFKTQFTKHRVETDFIPVNYFESNNGENLPWMVLLPGANAEPAFYSRFTNFLVHHYHVIFLEYPGIGNADRLKKVSEHTYLEWLDAAVKTIIDKPFEIAGISLGGLVACKYISQYKPKQVTRYIGLCPLTQLTSTKMHVLPIQFVRTHAQRIKTHFKPGIISMFDIMNFRYFIEKRRQWAIALFKTLTPKDVQFSTPKLVIYGEKDYVVDPRYTVKVFKDAPHTTLIEMHNKGHDGFALMGGEIIKILMN